MVAVCDVWLHQMVKKSYVLNSNPLDSIIDYDKT